MLIGAGAGMGEARILRIVLVAVLSTKLADTDLIGRVRAVAGRLSLIGSLGLRTILEV